MSRKPVPDRDAALIEPSLRLTPPWLEYIKDADKRTPGIPYSTTAPTNGQIYVYNSTTGLLEPTSIARATINATPANPTGTTSATPVMMGLGGTCKITPTYTGTVRINFTGVLVNNGALNLTGLRVYYGTGAAPANGAAATGTQVGTAVLATAAAASSSTPGTMGAIITGLTLSTQIWCDVGLNVSAGTGTFTNINFDAMEI